MPNSKITKTRKVWTPTYRQVIMKVGGFLIISTACVAIVACKLSDDAFDEGAIIVTPKNDNYNDTSITADNAKVLVDESKIEAMQDEGDFGKTSKGDGSNKAIADAEKLIDKSQMDAKAVEESLRNSYARLAAQRQDICPKLLQKDVDTNVIKRSNDIMVDDYCDYFIYPKVGQHIYVESNNEQLESLLIAPDLHNFANGDYTVASAQKHVIRVSYDGVERKPEALSYGVSVVLQ